MIPARFEPIVFSLLLSGMMSCIVSGIATFNSVGFPAGFVGLWMSAWVYSWIIAFPSVLVVAPIVRRLTAKLVQPREHAG